MSTVVRQPQGALLRILKILLDLDLDEDRAERLKGSGLSLERVRHRFRIRFACVEPLRGYTKAIQ
jgi:hypothetical protein